MNTFMKTEYFREKEKNNILLNDTWQERYDSAVVSDIVKHIRTVNNFEHQPEVFNYLEDHTLEGMRDSSMEDAMSAVNLLFYDLLSPCSREYSFKCRSGFLVDRVLHCLVRSACFDYVLALRNEADKKEIDCPDVSDSDKMEYRVKGYLPYIADGEVHCRMCFNVIDKDKVKSSGRCDKCYSRVNMSRINV